MRAYYVVDNCGEIEKSQTIEVEGLSKEDLSVYVMGEMFDSGYSNQIPFVIYINDGSGYDPYYSNNNFLEERVYASFFDTEPTMTTDSDGNKLWHLDDKRHRVDGPAVEWANGDKFWYLNDKLHRTDGPAVEYASGTKCWYLNGELHRTDGPAVEFASGFKLWYLNDKALTENQFNEQTKD